MDSRSCHPSQIKLSVPRGKGMLGVYELLSSLNIQTAMLPSLVDSTENLISSPDTHDNQISRTQLSVANKSLISPI
jgi:hypothetical protein